MKYSPLFELVIILTTSFQCLITMAHAISMAKPGCSDKCGNVTIPYPFGIGSRCSLNSSFIITCTNSTPILSSINREAVSISLESGLITVKQPILRLKCSSQMRTLSLAMSLAGGPFTISASHNSLMVLGCRNAVWLHEDGRSIIGGCMASSDADSTSNMSTSCTVEDSCRIPIPAGRKTLEINYQTVQKFGNSSSSCGYIFVADRLNDNEPLKSANVVLEWDLSIFYLASDSSLRCTLRQWQWQIDDPRCYVYNEWIRYGLENEYNGHDNFQMCTYRHCSCDQGFEGNPYLPQGCVDIDECRNSSLNVCHHSGVPCVNLWGNYYCDFPPWDKVDHKKSRILKVTFIVIGSVLGVLILLFASGRASICLCNCVAARIRRWYFKRNGGLFLEQHFSTTDGSRERVKLFTCIELAQATDHYNENRVLGRGGQGTVYKGMLADGRIVAVKKSKKIEEDDIETFINEIVILSQINHRNVVKLIGCCLETEIPLLVYEFILNGTLFQHIHEPSQEFPLTWEMRLRIAAEVADALSYLHSSATTPIYHRDIKSTNILLDDKYKAKVSDFGTSRSVAIDKTHITTKVLGTFGYLDPEYFQSSQFTEKSDVYSFGVVVVELLTGEKAVSGVVRSEGGRSLATHFLRSMEEDRLLEILDAGVVREGREEEIVAVAQLARRCLRLNGKKRPTMKEVAAVLESIRKSKGWQVLESMDEDEEGDVPDFYGFSSTMEFSGVDSVTIPIVADQ